jgi:hypothetical protein
MNRFRFSQCITALALAIGLAPCEASAQGPDTLSVSGTFPRPSLFGTPGADLAQVYADGDDHGWTLTLYGVTYSYDENILGFSDEYGYGTIVRRFTRVHAASLDFEFFGPDAEILNQVVSQQLFAGSEADGAFFELMSDEFVYDDGGYGGRSGYFRLGVSGSAGVSFSALSYHAPIFDMDENGYPLVEPMRIESSYIFIVDGRPGTAGVLGAEDGKVDIGSSVPPVLPPPPPPTLSIADGSEREGNKGTTRLNLEVTLSRSISDAVTVRYATAGGTAVATSDYKSTSGTLTFPAGETSRTISIAVKGDRKREKNETFSVQLSNAVGATIADGVATATILNDD